MVKAAAKCWNKQTDNLSDAEELCVLSFKEEVGILRGIRG